VYNFYITIEGVPVEEPVEEPPFPGININTPPFFDSELPSEFLITLDEKFVYRLPGVIDPLIDDDLLDRSVAKESLQTQAN